MKFEIEVPDCFVPDGYEIIEVNAGRNSAFPTDYKNMIEDIRVDLETAHMMIRKKPPVYREPTADDCGAMVEVMIDAGFNQFNDWKSAELLSVLPADCPPRFIIRTKEGYWAAHTKARIAS